MCGLLNTKLKVEVYKWSSAEFPQEYVVIYTFLELESVAIIFRVSVSPDKVLCRHASISPIYSRGELRQPRFHMEVTAERGCNGEYTFGKVEVAVANMDRQRTVEEKKQYHFWGVPCHCIVTHRDLSLARGNLSKRIWEVDHSFDIAWRTELKSHVSIRCDKEIGLRLEFNGPMKYSKNIVISDFEIDREVKGEPPSDYIEEVESEFMGKEYTLFEGPKENSGTESYVSLARGLINNIGARIQGNGNGSVFNQCQFHAPH